LVLIAFAGTHGAEDNKEAIAKVNRKGPLTDLPSPPGPHIEKIKALGENEWINLGAPAPDPKWGKACGRSWCSNIPFAPELNGAFLLGEGRHAYVKPDGYFMDDLWFYDVNAHRWICLYPGNNTKTIVQRLKDKELTIDERGLLVDKDQQPLPADLIHGWGYLAYDPDQHKFAYIMGQQFGCYFANGKGGVFEEANSLYWELRKGKEKPLTPFSYNTITGKFECNIATAPLPSSMRGLFNNLVYVPSRKKYFYGGGDGVYYLDPVKNAWTNANPKGPTPQKYDNGACYDNKRNRIWYGCENTLFFYDIDTNTWGKPELKGNGCSVYSAAFTSFYYDSINDKVMAFQYDAPWPSTAIFIFDPSTNAWLDPLEVPKPLAHTGRIAGSGFYDPALNAFFFHSAGDSSDNGEIWAYRYKRASK
jgi:hypothetical protein